MYCRSTLTELKTFRYHDLPCCFHQVQQPERTLLVQEEVLVHHEEALDAQACLQRAHDVKDLIAGLVELDEFSFAPEHGGGGAKIAPHRTTHSRDQHGVVEARMVG